MIDVNLPYTQPTTSPRISDFTERILLQLNPLMEGDEEIQNHVIEENEVEEQDERTQAIKLLKTGTSKACHVNRAIRMNSGLNHYIPSVSNVRSAEMVDCKCRTLLLHSCRRSITFASTAVQGEKPSFTALIRNYYQKQPCFLTIIYLPSVPDCSS